MRQLLFVLLLTIVAACGRDKPDSLVEGGYDKAAMENAVTRARIEVEAFIATFQKRDGSDFSVKVRLEQNGDAEHFWLSDITYGDGEFTGKIDNEPGIVTRVRFGDTVICRKAEVSDWMFMRDGQMHGNYTMRPLLETMEPEEAAYFRSLLAEP